MVTRILQAQTSLFRHHLPAPLFEKLETPQRHRGINSVKVRGTDQSKPPLLVLHGFGSGLGFFFATLPYLAATGRTVYLVDWLGCGGSERPQIKCRSSVTADFFTVSLHDWMRAEGVEQANIVAHSLGGLIAKEFSDKFPHTVSKLVLASPAGFGAAPAKNPAETFGRQLLDMLWSSNITPQQIVRLAGKERGYNLVSRAVQSRLGHASGINTKLLADYLYEITVARPSGEYALNGLLAPPFQQGALIARKPITSFQPGLSVDVVFGDKDWVGTPTSIENAAKSGARVSIMQRATHHLYLDRPAEFAQLCIA